MINLLGSFIAGATTLVTFVTLLPIAGPVGTIAVGAQGTVTVIGGVMGVIEHVNKTQQRSS